MKGKIAVCLFLLIIVCESCVLNNRDTRLSIDNRSGNLVYYEYELVSKDDTLLSLEHCETSSMYYIPPKSVEVISSLQNWGVLQSDSSLRLHVYIFNVDTVNSIGICDAWAKNKYLQRFDLSYDLLERMNWTVIFPADSIGGTPSPRYPEPNPNKEGTMIQKWESMTTNELQHPK